MLSDEKRMSGGPFEGRTSRKPSVARGVDHVTLEGDTLAMDGPFWVPAKEERGRVQTAEPEQEQEILWRTLRIALLAAELRDEANQLAESIGPLLNHLSEAPVRTVPRRTAQTRPPRGGPHGGASRRLRIVARGVEDSGT